MSADGIKVTIPHALNSALQRALPSADHGFAEWRVHQALMTFLRDRGIEITAEIAATVSHRTPATRTATNRAAPVRKRRTVRSMRRRRSRR